MKYEAIIVQTDGNLLSLDQWQKFYNLKTNSNELANYFSIGETNRFGQIVIKNRLIVAEPLLSLLDEYRRLKAKPVVLNSFDRSKSEQQILIDNPKYSAAKNSPHVYDSNGLIILPCMASDIDTLSKRDTFDSVRILEQAADKLGYEIRIGFKKYLLKGQTFIHVDVTPEYFGKNKVYENADCPWQWRKSLRW